MKMLKRIASCAMAAVMSLAMLTACGGGGSGSGSKDLTGPIKYDQSRFKAMSKTMESGTFTVNIEGTETDDETGKEISVKETLMKSGESYYVKMEYGTTVEALLKEGEEVYIIEMSNSEYPSESIYEKDNKAIHLNSSAGFDDEFDINSEIPSENEINEIVASKETYNGKEYYTEKVTATIDGKETSATYFFSGNSIESLEYARDEETKQVSKITISGSVDSSKLTVKGREILEYSDFMQ